MNLFRNLTSSRNLWNIKGSFGEFKEAINSDNGIYFSKNEFIEVKSEIIKDSSGVFVRRGKVKNISPDVVTLNTLTSLFYLNGGSLEVYTQYNGWQNESRGEWQNLVSGIKASSESVRNATDATPFTAIWSNEEGRGVALHLISYGAWEINFKKRESNFIEIEMGYLKDGFELKLAPGEEVSLPEIIYYDVENKKDLDAYKLHLYLAETHPGKEMPVIYNTWLYKFDRFSFDDIVKQIKEAKDLGIEYFVIDAGWFGVGENWWGARGDWEENETFGFKGKMKEISDLVRENGMKFGFWLEVECAAFGANIVREHPDYFVKGDSSYFLDFANEDAVRYIFNKTASLIEKYDAKFIKFDFNADLNYDKYKTAFIKYFEGHVGYIKMLKERFPDLYLENCASGGLRMTLRDSFLYDSFWPTDNQSPYDSMRIFKDTVLRMHPSKIEKWATILSAKEIAPVNGQEGFKDRIISTNDATWSGISGVTESFLEGFSEGSPIGLSTDLTAFSPELKEKVKGIIKEFKERRSFFKNSACHILADTESVLALEYRNKDFSEIEIVVYIKRKMQNGVTVVPILDEGATYEYKGEKISGKQLKCSGIDINVEGAYTAKKIFLKKEQ